MPPEASSPAPVQRALDGLLVAKAEANPHPIGMMIENLPVVRPQSGLAGASVIYETLAEGGATRFLAVYAGAGPALAKIGPVRSARPYYAEWVSEYDALYGHAGGSPDAIGMIQSFRMKDLNGIGREGKYFWRDKSISAPHNLFTSSELLSRALFDMQLAEGTSSFVPWKFVGEAQLSSEPTEGSSVTVQFSGTAYEVEWRYDPASNRYLRWNAGEPHTDALTGKQLAAKNVLVQVIPPILSIGEKGRLTLNVHGAGRAFLLMHGNMTTGTWKKTDRTGRTQFFNPDGTEMTLTAGTTWVEVVPEDRPVLATEYNSN